VLVLHSHPLASFCWKVLIALNEAGTPFEARLLDLADDAARAAHLERWPVGKMPFLIDEARGATVPESSIIVEYLDRYYPGPAPMLPADEEQRLEVRLWDRFFDLYVSTPMQKIVGDRLRAADTTDDFGVIEARVNLDGAYDMLEPHLASRTWAGGEDFSMADCSAAPALFYAECVHPFTPSYPAIGAYFDRLMARPSVMRVLDEAKPYFPFFPFRDAIPTRFL